MKAIPEWYASQSQVFHSFVLSSFWTSAFTLTEWVKWLRKHRQLYDSSLDPTDFGCLGDLLWWTKTNQYTNIRM